MMKAILRTCAGLALSIAAAQAITGAVGASGANAQPQANEPGGATKPAAPETSKPPTPANPDPHAAPLTIAGVTVNVPSPFDKQELKPGGMRAAQYTVIKPDDMQAPENAELVFFYFGPQGAGDVESNIARWASQVTDDQGKPVEPALRVIDAKPLHITEAAFEGTYASGMPGAAKTPRPDFALIGAIIEGGPEGMVVVRLTGPANVVKANRALWDAMLASARAAAK